MVDRGSEGIVDVCGGRCILKIRFGGPLHMRGDVDIIGDRDYRHHGAYRKKHLGNGTTVV